MKKWLLSLLLGAALALATAVGVAIATDRDGPNDCQRNYEDMGDAPEGMPAYPAVPGRFPTCTFGGPVGTQTFVCPPISTPPGPTGFVRHLGFPLGYWLGCYTSPLPPGGPMGVDTEPDGKVNTPAVGTSGCVTGLLTDCVEAAFGMTFDQDECYLDGSDAGVRVRPALVACTPAIIPYEAWNCAQTRQVYLNVCMDFNEDGDWNDNFRCPTSDGTLRCAYEWAVKNLPIVLTPGCNFLATPPFLVGPRPGRTWFRITLSDDPAPDDYPWNGSISTPAQSFHNGETEDYPAQIDQSTPTMGSTWGRVKTIYR